MVQSDLVRPADCGLSSNVLEDLEAFLYTLFVAKVPEAKASSIAGGVRYCSWEGAGVAQFS